jgi:hypothetical protein
MLKRLEVHRQKRVIPSCPLPYSDGRFNKTFAVRTICCLWTTVDRDLWLFAVHLLQLAFAFPSFVRARAPECCASENCKVRIGSISAHLHFLPVCVRRGPEIFALMPPAAAQTAMAAPPFPELSSRTLSIPCCLSVEIIKVAPRSLKLPVGANHSRLKARGRRTSHALSVDVPRRSPVFGVVY